MNLMQALAKVVWADTAFKAASPGGISAVLLPEGVQLPATTYRTIVGIQESTLETSGQQRMRVEFEFHADQTAGGYVAACAARRALDKVLNGFVGQLADEDSTYLQNVDPASKGADDYDSDPRQWRCLSEYYLIFTLS